MIEKLDAMPILVNACPSFEDAWQAHLREFGDDAHYVAAGELAHHLLQLFQANEVSTLTKVGEALESLVAEGSPFVQALTVVGVLEGIQIVWFNNKTDPESFFPYLGHASGKAWKELNRAWSGQVQ
jgi:hypothetical protein